MGKSVEYSKSALYNMALANLGWYLQQFHFLGYKCPNHALKIIILPIDMPLLETIVPSASVVIEICFILFIPVLRRTCQGLSGGTVIFHS